MNTATFAASEKAFNLFRFQRAMRHVGRGEILDPARVASLTAHAVSTGDRFLAAQILSRLGTLPPQMRQLRFLIRQELEGVIAGEDPGKANAAIAMARNEARNACGAAPASCDSAREPPDEIPNKN